MLLPITVYNIVQLALADFTTHIIRLLASTKNMALTYRKKTFKTRVKYYSPNECAKHKNADKHECRSSSIRSSSIQFSYTSSVAGMYRQMYRGRICACAHRSKKKKKAGEVFKTITKQKY